MPICWVRRWVRLVLAGKLKQVKKEYNINRSMDAEKLGSTGALLDRLGLK